MKIGVLGTGSAGTTLAGPAFMVDFTPPGAPGRAFELPRNETAR